MNALPAQIDNLTHSVALRSVACPLDLDEFVPQTGPWEVELGFGKGRYLLQRATEKRETRFLGIEIAAKYYRHARQRMISRNLSNLLLIQGEALYLLVAALPKRFAGAVHIYFPDPWPKARHQKRRLLDPETVDLVLDLLAPGGTLSFATDFVEYGEQVRELLLSHPTACVGERRELWNGGPRTNYESKYVRAGRPIVRLEVTLNETDPPENLHPAGRKGVIAAVR